MKADEKKENQTNSLRLWMDKTAERLKGRGLYVLVGSLVTAAVLIGITWFYFSSRAAAASARMMELYTADTDKKLEEIITSENQQGYITATLAKLDKARLALYRDGLEKTGSYLPKDREAAIAKIEEGRKLYLEIVEELKSYPSLQQECWLSCSKAEEALSRTPKTDKPNENRGSLDKRIEYLRKAAAIEADSDASKKYSADAEKLAKDKAEMDEFYRRLNQLGQIAPFEIRP